MIVFECLQLPHTHIHSFAPKRSRRETEENCTVLYPAHSFEWMEKESVGIPFILVIITISCGKNAIIIKFKYVQNPLVKLYTHRERARMCTNVQKMDLTTAIVAVVTTCFRNKQYGFIQYDSREKS